MLMQTNDSIHHNQQVKQAFQQAQKLDALDHVARSLIHELKNCLGGISGAAELIEFDHGDNQGISDLLKVIMSSTDAANNAISTLSHFLHHKDSQHNSVNIHDFINQQYKFYTACLGKNVPVELRNESTDPLINCDELLLAHTCMNVVLNAHESITERGKLNISTMDRDIEEHSRPPFMHMKPGAYLDLCFADTGCGIDPKDLEHICKPGFSSKELHAGMGLVLVDEFMRQQGGYLRIESTKDAGTKVHLLFARTAS